MTRTYLLVLFACASLAGLGLIAYGLLAGSRRKVASVQSDKLPLGFSDSPEQPFEILDLNIGHEGLMHREKERFDPARRRPEHIGSGKKSTERVPVDGQENKSCKIEVS